MIVLDASVIIDCLLPKRGYNKSREVLESISKSRIAVHAPMILKIELASVLSMKTCGYKSAYENTVSNWQKSRRNG